MAGRVVSSSQSERSSRSAYSVGSSSSAASSSSSEAARGKGRTGKASAKSGASAASVARAARSTRGTASAVSSAGSAASSASGKARPRRTASGKASTDVVKSPSRTPSARAASGRTSPSAPRAAAGRVPARSDGAGAKRSRPGEFVDARKLDGEDLVAKTLRENTGAIGLATRPKVVDFTARVKERKRASARVVALRVAVGAFVAAALGGLGWLLFLSPVLLLDSSQVSVSGANQWVSEAQVRDIVGEQVGRSLLLVDTRAMTESMTSIPGVTDAKAVKRYPHGLAVAITSQRPAAMLKASGGDTLTAVDSKARVLNSVGDTSVDGIPVIEVKDVDAALDSRAVKETLKVLDDLPESLRERVSKVTCETQDSVTTELDDGALTIVWGDSSDMKLKKAVTDKIVNDPNVLGDKTQVDVSAPLRPVLR